ncbi:MAG: hypothetical protein DRQ61_04565 [Gammaproteobacteria bacterium]|nr:MAG: hypothetical protein DRQ61_04565 [Gammaproteobacteria bacterium]
MPTWIILLLGVALLVAAALLLRGRNEKPEKQKQSVRRTVASLTPKEQLERIRQSERFWGVAIETREDSHACKAVHKVVDREFQTYDVPKLPLEECDNVNCRCRYYGLPDLRKSERRETTSDRRQSIRYEPNKDNRRIGEDRRKADELWKNSNTQDL